MLAFQHNGNYTLTAPTYLSAPSDFSSQERYETSKAGTLKSVEQRHQGAATAGERVIIRTMRWTNFV